MNRGPKPRATPADPGSSLVAFPWKGAPKVHVDEPTWDRPKFDGASWKEAHAALAKEKWQKVIDAMTKVGTLSPANEAAVEMLATQYATWRLAQDHIAEHGPVVAAPRTGVPQQNPYVSIANKALTQVLKIEAELGISPTMRGRTSKAPAARSGPDLFNNSLEAWEGRRSAPSS